MKLRLSIAMLSVMVLTFSLISATSVNAISYESSDQFGMDEMSPDPTIVDWRSNHRYIAGDHLVNFPLDVGSNRIIHQLGTSFWTQQEKLTASDATERDFFGDAVSVSGDIAVIGAPDKDGEKGAVYVFERIGGKWNQQAKLTADSPEEGDRFGYSVALSGDTIVVGVPQDNDNGKDSGSAYIFIREGGRWVQQAKLTANDAAERDEFGYSVAISSNMVVIGAIWDDNEPFISGSAYIFENTGAEWSQQAKLVPDDPNAQIFGHSVAISGATVVIGSPWDDQNGDSSGAVYVFDKIDTGWKQQAKLIANDGGESYDRLGSTVAIIGDIIVAGAPWHDSTGTRSGAAYVFERTNGTWSQQTKLIAADAMPYDKFGNSVGISGDTIVVGASGDSGNNTNTGREAAYVFEYVDGTWHPQVKLTANDSEKWDFFGASVAISEDTVISGAFGDDDAASFSGSAYVFIRFPIRSMIFTPVVYRNSDPVPS